LPRALKKKMNLEREKEDPLLRNLGHRVNAGYLIQGHKEFLKVKPTDSVEAFPSTSQYSAEDYKQSLVTLFEALRSLARSALKATATYQVPLNSKAATAKTQARIKAEIQEGGYTSSRGSSSYMSKQLYEDVDKLSFDRSSISLIHYFAQKDYKFKQLTAARRLRDTHLSTTSESPSESNDSKPFSTFSTSATAPASSTVTDKVVGAMGGGMVGEQEMDEKQALQEACQVHTDTGILTFIICSDVSGLHVEDRTQRKPASTPTRPVAGASSAAPNEGEEKWLEVEKIFESGVDLFCIVGRKMHMFARGDVDRDADGFTPTIHRVHISPEIERSSLLYFMDARNQDG